jgi:hypothetical protein
VNNLLFVTFGINFALIGICYTALGVLRLMGYGQNLNQTENETQNDTCRSTVGKESTERPD